MRIDNTIIWLHTCIFTWKYMYALAAYITNLLNHKHQASLEWIACHDGGGECTRIDGLNCDLKLYRNIYWLILFLLSKSAKKQKHHNIYASGWCWNLHALDLTQVPQQIKTHAVFVLPTVTHKIKELLQAIGVVQYIWLHISLDVTCILWIDEFC